MRDATEPGPALPVAEPLAGDGGLLAFLRRQPWRVFLVIFAVWAVFATLHLVVRRAHPSPFVAVWFPISQFWGPAIHRRGLPYAALFLGVLFVALKNVRRLGVGSLWLVGLSLILLGNLEQGSVRAAFLDPLDAFGIQYFNDAVKITSWTQWLADFNANQPTLLGHSETHPPFAVLIHYWCFHLFGGSLAGLGAAMILLASLAVPIVWLCLGAIGAPTERRNLLTLLFAAIPAFNIYSAVSLDAVIATAASLFLLGLLLVMERPNAVALGIALCSVGFVLTNLLTFGGSFLLAIGLVLALREVALRMCPASLPSPFGRGAGGEGGCVEQTGELRSSSDRPHPNPLPKGEGTVSRRALWSRNRVALAVAASAVSLSAVVFLMHALLGYNHVQGFLTASKIENPYGFRGFYEPAIYFITRSMAVGEIALFLSLGCLAALLSRKALAGSMLRLRDDATATALCALGVLAAMFVAGAYHNGETGRACLFIYPFLLLLFARADWTLLKDLVVLAGLQTSAMQLFGGYSW
ncbi:MAG: hypothetical protein ABFC96_15410 [Thermoguttaceae bacterium]